MTTQGMIALSVAGVGGVGVVLAGLLGHRDERLASRLDDMAEGPKSPGVRPLMADLARSTLPKVGTALVPEDEEERTKLQTRLRHAGLYGRQAMVIFLGVKLILMVLPATVGFLLGMAHVVSPKYGMIAGGILSVGGMVGPSFWLDSRKKKRQMILRRSLPDALDVMVMCVEGGLNLAGAMSRISTDLAAVHPELATEIRIADREMQLGRTAGEALRRLGERTDLEEFKGLANAIIQSERFGAGLIKPLKVHADTLRLKRQQRAEEMAQKASTKILLPTLLFIFPAIFVVILAPAAIQINKTMMNN
jgi:tight adherence protein C